MTLAALVADQGFPAACSEGRQCTGTGLVRATVKTTIGRKIKIQAAAGTQQISRVFGLERHDATHGIGTIQRGSGTLGHLDLLDNVHINKAASNNVIDSGSTVSFIHRSEERRVATECITQTQ